METLLSSLNNLGIDGEDEEGLQGLLETMMSQLMSKEVLYEPLKEMHEKVR
jgi:peroxin-19